MKQFNDLDDLQLWFEEVGIDVANWGRGESKHIEDLWEEISSGETVLQDDPPLRILNVVQVIIRKNDTILMEIEQEFDTGRRRSRNRPPSEKMKPDEGYIVAALRCINEELGLDSQKVVLDIETYKQELQILDSPSFPGLQTKFNIHSIEAVVEGLPEEDFWRENVAFHSEGSDPVKRHHWGWVREEELGFNPGEEHLR